MDLLNPHQFPVALCRLAHLEVVAIATVASSVMVLAALAKVASGLGTTSATIHPKNNLLGSAGPLLPVGWGSAFLLIPC